VVLIVDFELEAVSRFGAKNLSITLLFFVAISFNCEITSQHNRHIKTQTYEVRTKSSY
jgi:hypothetical protein